MSNGIQGSSAKIKVYQPGRNLGWGPAVWMEMGGELWASRELTRRLFWREFAVRYKQTALGPLWVVIMPLAVVGAFALLNRSGVVNFGPVEVPYPAYALLGVTVWQIFAGGLLGCTNAIVAGGSMVVKINFPKETLVLAALGQTLVDTLVRLVLVVAVFLYYRVVPAWTLALFPLALVPLFCLTLGLGFGLSLLNALWRDTANVVSIGATFLLFLSPVLYPAPATGLFQTLTRYNPMAALVTGARDLVIRGSLSEPDRYFLASGLGLLFLLAGWRAFHLAEVRMAERMGTG